MIDLLKIEPTEAERIAYAEGFPMAAELFARIADLEAERNALQLEIEDLKSAAAKDSLKKWEKKNGPAKEYMDFFFNCFSCLAGDYPAPDVSSDYDKTVIFEAIEKGADK
jgi:hypothetical protein